MYLFPIKIGSIRLIVIVRIEKSLSNILREAMILFTVGDTDIKRMNYTSRTVGGMPRY